MASKVSDKRIGMIPEREKKIALITKDERPGADAEDLFGIVLGYKDMGAMKVIAFKEPMSNKDEEDLMADSTYSVIIQYDEDKITDSTEVWWTPFDVVIRTLNDPNRSLRDKKIIKEQLIHQMHNTSKFIKIKIRDELKQLIALLRKI